MTVAGAATSHTKKLMKLTLSVIWPRFNSSKCKTAAKMAVARIKLLRNKREVVVRQMRRDIALLLQSGQDATARIRVEHVIREQNVLAANEFIELFCELVVSRLPIIAKRKECPADLKEGIASIIFASPRCSEIPELTSLRKIFEKKYGKDFVSTATDLRPNSGVNRLLVCIIKELLAHSHSVSEIPELTSLRKIFEKKYGIDFVSTATDLRPNSGVNRLLVDKLSVRTPSGELKLKIMKEIAKEHQIQWDTAECEKELLKPPEELIEGHRTFVSASSLPVPKSAEPSVPISRSISKGTGNVHFQDMASAAEESAKQAIAAAQAAAYMANKGNRASTFDHNLTSGNHGFGGISGNSTGLPMPNDPKTVHQIRNYQSNAPGAGPIQMNEETRSVQMNREHTYRRYSYYEIRPASMDGHGIYWRDSYNNPSLHSDIKFDEEDCKGVDRSHSYNTTSSPHSDVKFDESDYGEEIEMEEPHARVYPPPNRPAPRPPSSLTKRSSFPQIHPKLPDYDALSARFESLKHRKS